MDKVIIPLDISGSEIVDFVGQVPPLQTGPGTTPRITPKNKQVLFRVLTWNNPDPPPQGRRGKILNPEYDFNEITKATDTDGILRVARDKQVICMMKDKWWFQGKNPRTKAYIERRISEITRMSRMSFDEILRDAAKNLVEHGNFFLYLHRHAQFSSGNRVKIQGKMKDPIAAIHPMDVTTIRPVLGDTVEVRSWYQYLENQPFYRSNRTSPVDITSNSDIVKRYDVRDIIHGFAWRRTGYIFGTPPAVPVLDDVRALRRLEEISEIVAHRHAFPLVHVQVGTEKVPMRMLANGMTEVDVVRDAYESMKMEGALITSERAKVDAIQTKPMQLEGMLQHFIDRVVTGLGLSDMDIGRGGSANRGTATILSRSLMDRCKDLQQVVAGFINWQLLDVLLVEGGFDINPENRVFLRFPEVDIERMLQISNNAVDMYNSNAITEDEMREMMGRDPISDAERKRMVFELVNKPAAIIKAVDEPFTAAAKKVRSSTRPTNQSGTKSAKTTPVNDSMNTVLDNIRQLRNQIVSYIEQSINDQKSIDDRRLWEFADEAGEKLIQSVVIGTQSNVHNGFTQYVKDTKSARTFVYTGALRRRFTKHCVQPIIDRLLGTREDPGEFSSLVKKLRTTVDGRYALKTVAYFDSWIPIWASVCDTLSEVAHRFGFAQATWIDGAHTVGWKSDAGLRTLSPAQASYHELIDTQNANFCMHKTDRLPKIDLSVVESSRSLSACTIKINTGLKNALDLSKPGRQLSVLLDNGERTVLTNDIIDGWEFTIDGTLRIPHLESGVVELWDSGRMVGRTRFVLPEENKGD